MLSNLHDIWVITNEYRGTGFLIVLYVIALLYLFITEKNRNNRLLTLYAPLTLLVLIYNPVFYHMYVVYLDDSGTYYRIFWLLPMAVTTIYAGCKAMYKHRRIGLVLMVAIIIACGGYTYSTKGQTTIKKAENAYHIPQYVIDLCDYMDPVLEGVNVYACVPTEMLFYVRQYNPDICLIYGRDAVEPKWGYYNEFYELYEINEIVDIRTLLNRTRNNDDKVCVYFVLDKDRRLGADPADFGLEEVARVENFILYRDTEAVKIIREMFKGTAYEQ